jgi:hypothetical protein
MPAKRGKRAVRFNIDLNLLSIKSLENIQKIVESEIAEAKNTNAKLMLLTNSYILKGYIDTRKGITK